MKKRSPSREKLKTGHVILFILIILPLAFWFFQSPPLSTPPVPVDHIVGESSESTDYHSARAILEKMKPSETLRDKLAYVYPKPVHGPLKKDGLAASKPEIKRPQRQSWKDFAVPADAANQKAKIVVIIDDMGMDRKHSYEAINLDAPLTLAFLPYAPQLEKITTEARAKSHELLIHVPMQPMDKLNPGPVALVEGMSNEEFDSTLDKIFNSFSGYVGINNHMGSRLTQNESAMHRVMNALADRGLLFVDSKTIATSVAAKVAAQHGLYYAERDIFLDHEDNIDFVRSAIADLEKIARRRGYAIAIGHPKAATLEALKEWLPVSASRGFVVVPVSAVVRRDIPRAVKQVTYGPVQSPSPLPQ